MKNLKIKNKIFVLMATLLVVVAASSLFQLVQMSQINDQSSIIADEWLVKVEKSMAINLDASNYRRSQYAAMISKTEKDISTQKQRMNKAAESIENDMTALEKMLTTDIEKQHVDAFKTTWKSYLADGAKINALIEQGLTDEALVIMQTTAYEDYSKANQQLQDLVQENKDGAATASNHADAMFAQNKLIAIGLIVVLFSIGIMAGLLLVRNVATPIRKITDYMGILASGNLQEDVPDRDRKDEIGVMAAAIQVFKDNMVKAKELEAEARKDEMAKQKRQANVNHAIEKFQHSMADIVRFVSSASTELQASAQSLSASAEETSKQSGAVAAASQQAAANVQTVASATEELSSSINEISSQVSRSSQVASKAVQDAEQAGASVAELVEAAQKIGDVTKIISGIAEQTNLLALNATIEAARAGDAGKGFAVVASEVKNLANESTKATEEIAGQIAHIQSISQTSAEAIQMICNVIREIDEISGIISAAIQEQTSATQEISRNVSEAYTGTSEVTQNIGSVSDAANDTGSSAHQVLAAADELSRQSEILKEEFDTFIHSLEAA